MFRSTPRILATLALLLFACEGTMSAPRFDGDTEPPSDAGTPAGDDASTPPATDAGPPTPDPICGDGVCARETCASCADDCGACPLPPDTEPPRDDSPLFDLAAGEWLEVENSHLEDVAPEGWSGQVIRAWNGGAYDTRRHRLVLFGGGHNNYSGNELYAFDLDDLAWERLTDPADPYCRTSWRDGVEGCVGVVNPDGTPISRHTYGGVAYHHGLDALYAWNGAPDSQGGGCGTPGVWLFHFARGAWELYEDDRDTGPAIGCELKAVYDPVDERIIHRLNGYFTYDFVPGCSLTNADFGSDPSGGVACPGSWERVGPSPSGLRRGYDVGGRTVVLADGALYEVGANDRATPNSTGVGSQVWRIDPSSGYARTELDTGGDNACTAAANPGVAYHAPSNRLVCWRGGSTIYSLPLDGSLTWERHDYDGPVVAPEITASGGVYGRFRYSPVYDVFVMVNAIGENVFIYRLPAPL